MSNQDQMSKLLELARRLGAVGIHYRLYHSRDDAVGIKVVVPGERWEIEFLAEGTIEIERFISDGSIGDEELLDDLFRRFSD